MIRTIRFGLQAWLVGMLAFAALLLALPGICPRWTCAVSYLLRNGKPVTRIDHVVEWGFPLRVASFQGTYSEVEGSVPDDKARSLAWQNVILDIREVALGGSYTNAKTSWHPVGAIIDLLLAGLAAFAVMLLATKWRLTALNVFGIALGFLVLFLVYFAHESYDGFPFPCREGPVRGIAALSNFLIVSVLVLGLVCFPGYLSRKLRRDSNSAHVDRPAPFSNTPRSNQVSTHSASSSSDPPPPSSPNR